MLRSTIIVAWLIPLAACGGRGIGSGDPDASATPDGAPVQDAGLTPDAGPPPDAETSATCDPMDAVQVGNGCPVQQPMGWAFDGGRCRAIYCECAGTECDMLFASESACLADYHAECLPLGPCPGLSFDECNSDPDCRLVFFGGGCFDMAACDPPDGEGNVCIAEGFACVPGGSTCHTFGEGDCNGACHWVSFANEMCIGECCRDVGYGYCETNQQTQLCSAQDMGSCPDDCVDPVGYRWDGATCRPVPCCCEGPDCADIYPTVQECVHAHGECVAGCPSPITGGAWYVAFSPEECADLDWDCLDPSLVNFESSCGCGCYEPTP